MELILAIRAYEAYIGWIYANCTFNKAIENPLISGDNSQDYYNTLEKFTENLIERATHRKVNYE